MDFNQFFEEIATVQKKSHLLSRTRIASWYSPVWASRAPAIDIIVRQYILLGAILLFKFQTLKTLTQSVSLGNLIDLEQNFNLYCDQIDF